MAHSKMGIGAGVRGVLRPTPRRAFQEHDVDTAAAQAGRHHLHAGGGDRPQDAAHRSKADDG